MYFYSYWLFQWVNLTNIQHLSVKFYVPPFHLFRNFSKIGGGGGKSPSWRNGHL